MRTRRREIRYRLKDKPSLSPFSSPPDEVPIRIQHDREAAPRISVTSAANVMPAEAGIHDTPVWSPPKPARMAARVQPGLDPGRP